MKIARTAAFPTYKIVERGYNDGLARSRLDLRSRPWHARDARSRRYASTDGRQDQAGASSQKLVVFRVDSLRILWYCPPYSAQNLSKTVIDSCHQSWLNPGLAIVPLWKWQ